MRQNTKSTLESNSDTTVVKHYTHIVYGEYRKSLLLLSLAGLAIEKPKNPKRRVGRRESKISFILFFADFL